MTASAGEAGATTAWLPQQPAQGARALATGQAVWAGTGLMMIALAALIALVAFSPHRPLYDEPYYLNYVALLHQYGLTVAFIRAVPGPAGPLYAFVHAAAEPVTKLDPVRMRFVNVCLLIGVMCVLGARLKRQQQWDYWATPLLTLAVPMTWVLSGMALTEAPALLFVTLSLYFLLRGLDAFQLGLPVWREFLAGGVFLGIAVWGRQPYLLLAGVVVMLALADRRLLWPAAVFVGVLVVIVAPLIIVWHGLIPPGMERVKGVAGSHALLSLSYAGLCFFLLAPRFFRSSAKGLVGLAALTLIGNAIAGVTLYPMHTLASRLIPERLFPLYGDLCGSVFMWVGLVFLACTLRALWSQRTDLGRVAVYAGLLCVSLSPVFVVHQYSSRYTAMALPFLILAAHDSRRWQAGTVLLSGVGGTIGFLSLYSYLYL